MYSFGLKLCAMHAFDTVGRFLLHFPFQINLRAHFMFFPLRKLSECFVCVFFRLKWIFCCFIDIIYLVGQTNDIRFFIVIAIYIEKPPHYLVSLFLGDTCCGCMRETANAPNHNRNLFIYWHTQNMRRVFPPLRTCRLQTDPIQFDNHLNRIQHGFILPAIMQKIDLN